MLLIGTMNITRTRSTGDFFCPTCGILRDYRLRARRPFLTIYFIPLIPIGGAEEFVQCSTCKTNSPIVALEHDERSFREELDSQFRKHAFEASVMVAVAGGAITERQIVCLLGIAERLFAGEIDREALGSVCSSIRQNRVTVKNFVTAVSRPWSMPQKTEALQMIFIAASADGQLEPAQVKTLAWLKEHFGMTNREYEDAIEDAIEMNER